MKNPLKIGGGSVGKKLLGIAVLAFLAYVLFSNPVGAAGAVNGGVAGVESGANSITTFVQHLDTGGGS